MKWGSHFCVFKKLFWINRKGDSKEEKQTDTDVKPSCSERYWNEGSTSDSVSRFRAKAAEPKNVKSTEENKIICLMTWFFSRIFDLPCRSYIRKNVWNGHKPRIRVWRGFIDWNTKPVPRWKTRGARNQTFRSFFHAFTILRNCAYEKIPQIGILSRSQSESRRDLKIK